MAIARDLQLLIAAVAAIARIAGARILPGFWLRLIVLVVGRLVAALRHRGPPAKLGRDPIGSQGRGRRSVGAWPSSGKSRAGVAGLDAAGVAGLVRFASRFALFSPVRGGDRL